MRKVLLFLLMLFSVSALANPIAKVKTLVITYDFSPEVMHIARDLKYAASHVENVSVRDFKAITNNMGNLDSLIMLDYQRIIFLFPEYWYMTPMLKSRINEMLASDAYLLSGKEILLTKFKKKQSSHFSVYNNYALQERQTIEIPSEYNDLLEKVYGEKHAQVREVTEFPAINAIAEKTTIYQLEPEVFHVNFGDTSESQERFIQRLTE